MTPILAVDRLTKLFPAPSGGAIRAVQDVSFSLARGEVLGLVGESGSGKSTIARLLLNLLKPTAGTIRFAGADIAGMRTAEMKMLRRRVQMVFQDPYSSLNPYMTVGAALSEALRIHRLHDGAAAREQRIAALLDSVGLRPEHAARYPHEFSGGQRQRIGIARALAVEPEVIVADEPVAALDVSVQAQILNLLQAMRAQLGLSILLVAHDLAVIHHIADRVVVLYLGRIMEVGPADPLFANPLHPYTRALLSAVPTPDPDATIARRAGRVVLRGEIPSPAAPPSGCVFRTRCPHAMYACAEAVPALREMEPRRFKACIRDDIAA